MRPPFSYFIISLTAAVVSIAGYGILYNVISAKSAHVAELQKEIDTKTESISRITSARAALSEIAGDEAEVQNYFVPETAVVGFIDDLESRGTKAGAHVTVLSVSTGVTGTQPTLSLSVTTKGTFDAVMRTVGTIEYAPYDLSISTLSVAQDGKNSWHADMQLLVGSVSKSATSTSSAASTTAKKTP